MKEWPIMGMVSRRFVLWLRIVMGKGRGEARTRTLQQFSRVRSKMQRRMLVMIFAEYLLVPVSCSCYRQARYWPGVLRYPLPNLDLSPKSDPSRAARSDAAFACL